MNAKPAHSPPRRVLAVDVGGTHVKALLSGCRGVRKILSGPRMTPQAMVKQLTPVLAGWTWDAVAIGYPGPVVHGRPLREPYNLGGGWVGFDFAKAFGAPVKMLNDAAMQALGSYHGRRMLFLGLGTGLGSAMIIEGEHHPELQPMELAHLPYRKGKTYEDYLGERGLQRSGKLKWQRHVAEVVRLLTAALDPDYVVLGGGNARLLTRLPPNAELGNNANAFRGAFRLWR